MVQPEDGVTRGVTRITHRCGVHGSGCILDTPADHDVDLRVRRQFQQAGVLRSRAAVHGPRRPGAAEADIERVFVEELGRGEGTAVVEERTEGRPGWHARIHDWVAVFHIERVALISWQAERLRQYPVRGDEVVPVGQRQGWIVRRPAQDALEPVEVHAVPGQEKEAAVLALPPGRMVSLFWRRAMHIRLEAPAARIVRIIQAELLHHRHPAP